MPGRVEGGGCGTYSSFTDLRELLGRLAGCTGQVLNLSAAGEGLALSRTTLEEHTRLPEDLFLIERLRACGKTLRVRTVAAPKVHVIDSGVAARLLRVSPAKLAGLGACSRLSLARSVHGAQLPGPQA